MVSAPKAGARPARAAAVPVHALFTKKTAAPAKGAKTAAKKVRGEEDRARRRELATLSTDLWRRAAGLTPTRSPRGGCG